MTDTKQTTSGGKEVREVDVRKMLRDLSDILNVLRHDLPFQGLETLSYTVRSVCMNVYEILTILPHHTWSKTHHYYFYDLLPNLRGYTLYDMYEQEKVRTDKLNEIIKNQSTKLENIKSYGQFQAEDAHPGDGERRYVDYMKYELDNLKKQLRTQRQEQDEMDYLRKKKEDERIKERAEFMREQMRYKLDLPESWVSSNVEERVRDKMRLEDVRKERDYLRNQLEMLKIEIDDKSKLRLDTMVPLDENVPQDDGGSDGVNTGDDTGDDDKSKLHLDTKVPLDENIPQDDEGSDGMNTGDDTGAGDKSKLHLDTKVPPDENIPQYDKGSDGVNTGGDDAAGGIQMYDDLMTTPPPKELQEKCSEEGCAEFCELSGSQRMKIAQMEGVVSIKLLMKTKRYLITTYNDPAKVESIKEKIKLDEELKKHAFDFKSVGSKDDAEVFFASNTLLDAKVMGSPRCGTMGAYVKCVNKSTRECVGWYVATCYHVFPLCPKGHNVSTRDDSNNETDIGTLAYTIDPYTPIDIQKNGKAQTYDLALVELNQHVKIQIATESCKACTMNTDYVREGVIQKIGKTTGHTTGTILSMHYTGTQFYKEGEKEKPILICNSIEIEGSCRSFFELGDSGAIAYEKDKKRYICIGMCYMLTKEGTCLAFPLGNALKALEQENDNLEFQFNCGGKICARNSNPNEEVPMSL